MLIVYTLSYLSSVLVYFVLSFAFTLNCYTGSRGWLRSIDLWVMGPARSRCATLLACEESVQFFKSNDGQACAKLRHRWMGPFKVLQVLSPTTVKLELPSTIRVNPVFNVSVLKPYEMAVDEPDDELSEEPAVMEDLPPSPIIDQDGQERFIVEKVLKHKFVRKKTLFLVKWFGYEEPTWEPREFLLDESGAPICPLQTYLDNS